MEQPTPQLRLRFYTVPKALDQHTLMNVAITAGGYTLTPATGGWVDTTTFNTLSPRFGQGSLVEEPSAVLEVIVPDDHRNLGGFVEYLVTSAARAVGESAVMVTTETIDSRTVTL